MVVNNWNNGRWSEEEHRLFLTAMTLCRTWAERSEFIGTRSPRQVKSHYLKLRGAALRYIRRIEHVMPAVLPLALDVSSIPSALDDVDLGVTNLTTGEPTGSEGYGTASTSVAFTSEATGDEPLPYLTDIFDGVDDDELYAMNEPDDNAVTSAEGSEMLDGDQEADY